MNKAGIRSKLLSAFLVTIFLLTFLNIFLGLMHFRIVGEYQKITDNMFLEYSLIGSVTNMTELHYVLIKNVINDSSLQKYRASQKEVVGILDILNKSLVDKESRIVYRGLSHLILSIDADCEASLRDAQRGDAQKGLEIYTSIKKKNIYVNENVVTLILKELDRAKVLRAQFQQTHLFVIITGTSLLIFVTTGCVVFVFFFSSRLIAPLTRLTLWAEHIAGGDMTGAVDQKLLDRRDELGSLSNSFNRMVVHLRQNIAERESSQLAMQKAKEEAEVANTVKSEFLANMSHEIRTPLNAILGFSDLLSSTSVDEKQKEYLRTITSSSEILIAIVNDILDFSKLEAGKVQLENIDFDLGNLVYDVFHIAKIRFQGQEINSYIDWDAPVPQWVKGDPTRVRQILLNLLNNAAKFTKQGEIGVIVRLDHTTPYGPVVSFCVKDTGIGIPEDKKPKLFESFSQVDSSTTRRYGGTGLGLAICKKLVDVMGGKIWIESKEGHGSQFFFTVPFDTGTSLIPQLIDPLSKAQLMNKTVLCVDDHRTSLDILFRYCSEIGLKVLVASSGEEVLHKLDELSAANSLPDLILSDVRMPDMDGYMMVEKIRGNPKFKSIKIVAVTSDARIGGATFAQEKGFHAYLPKPFVRNDLNKVISTVLGDRRPVSAPIITRHIAAEVSLKGIRVLVVDDVASNQQLMKAYLNMLGCVSEFASNGQEAVDKIRAGRYEICLMDVQMPVLDGIEATKIIRSEISKELPIIALTAAVMKEEIDKTLDAGMNDFLIKPLSINMLKTKLIKFVCS